jgi:hypothetical protein
MPTEPRATGAVTVPIEEAAVMLQAMKDALNEVGLLEAETMSSSSDHEWHVIYADINRRLERSIAALNDRLTAAQTELNV